jgi:hypothetical protein
MTAPGFHRILAAPERDRLDLFLSAAQRLGQAWLICDHASTGMMDALRKDYERM